MSANRHAASESRTVAPHTGGVVAFPMLITRNVLPQMVQQTRNANHGRVSFDVREAAELTPSRRVCPARAR